MVAVPIFKDYVEFQEFEASKQENSTALLAADEVIEFEWNENIYRCKSHGQTNDDPVTKEEYTTNTRLILKVDGQKYRVSNFALESSLKTEPYFIYNLNAPYALKLLKIAEKSYDFKFWSLLFVILSLHDTDAVQLRISRKILNRKESFDALCHAYELFSQKSRLRVKQKFQSIGHYLSNNAEIKIQFMDSIVNARFRNDSLI